MSHNCKSWAKASDSDEKLEISQEEKHDDFEDERFLQITLIPVPNSNEREGT